MTEIEKKALALLNEHSDYELLYLDEAEYSTEIQALCRAIEQHEAFRQEVSDAVENVLAHRDDAWIRAAISRFILPEPKPKPKPDPLVEALNEMDPDGLNEGDADNLRAALAKRGLKIVEVE